MATDNYYDRARELQALLQDMSGHISKYHSASWRITFEIGDTFYEGSLYHLDSEKTELRFSAITGADDRKIGAKEFWAALDLYFDSYSYAVAYNYDIADFDDAVETAHHGEQHVLEIKASRSLYDDRQGEKLNMRLHFFRTKNDALVWSLQMSNPQVIAQNNATLGPTFHWWKKV